MSGAVAAIIPARIGSTRLPEKPLLRETGKYLIQHVYERVQAARGLDQVMVATDDQRIVAAVESFGGAVVMTSADHRSGTDRVAEVARSLDVVAVLNIQGDEPEIDPEDVTDLAAAIRQPGIELVTQATPIRDESSWRDPNTVKVVADAEGNALYFSRAPIPWSERFDPADSQVRKHLGVYGYRRELLFRLAALPPAPLEQVERLEQLRALHHGIQIRVLEARHDSLGIDTMDDYRRFVERMSRQAGASS